MLKSGIRLVIALPPVASLLLLQACVMVPRTTEAYDAECKVSVKQMDLQPVQLASVQGCSNNGCAALLAVAGVSAAASTLISGGIVIVGNAAYWLDKQGRCQRGGGSE